MKIANTAFAVLLLAGSALSTPPALAQGASSGGQQGGTGTTVLPRQGQSGTSQDAPAAPQPQGQTGGSAQDQSTTPQSTTPQSGMPQSGGSDNTQSTQDQQQQQPGSTTGSGGGSTSDSDAGSGAGSTGTTGQQPSTDSTRDSQQGTTGSSSQSGQTSSGSTSTDTGGSVEITTEQKTEIRNVIVESDTEPVSVDFDIDVGVAVPETVTLHPLPPRIIELVPAYRSYVYFILPDRRIVIVEPSTHKIVYIIA